ncbi:hypothetical protein F3Y22_tig00113279pilonHSYRG00013 [Hibiscus syriacus]|uniref:DNA (Cytosine-5)-methyltransferase DRM1/2 n=1 Tax=Hibiscus syriacus TaxID=106335 RepID=A0A6A2WPE7_HIBSY|nr:hypothetical protein F3Y22_tig00113279pilonHSYRG00013 [Hibiscus syriacus]
MKRSFNVDFIDIDNSFDTEEILNSDSDKEKKLLYLTKMGYSEAEASITMERYGLDSSIAELIDFICVSQMAKAADALLLVEDRKPLCNDPNYKKMRNSGYDLTLPENAIGPPYFYYEKVALAPVGAWTEMSRFPLIPFPPRTIHDAFPFTKMVAFLDSKNKVELFTNMYRKCQIDRKDLNKVVPLEPDEVEMLLEVAFYCLGIPLKADVQELNGDQLEQLMSRFGGFNLVIDDIHDCLFCYSKIYPILLESWKCLADSETGYLNFWNPIKPTSVESVPMSYFVPYVLKFKFSNLLKDIMDIILTKKMIGIEEVAMMYQDLSQHHSITRVQLFDLFIPIIHLNGTYSSVIEG